MPFVLRYHVPNKYKYLEQYVRHLLCVSFIHSGMNLLYCQNVMQHTSKLTEQHVLETVNQNKLIIKPHGDC